MPLQLLRSEVGGIICALQNEVASDAFIIYLLSAQELKRSVQAEQNDFGRTPFW